MHDRLLQILADKEAEVQAGVRRESVPAARARALAAPPVRDFARALKERLPGQVPAVIAEIKFASPAVGALMAGSTERAVEVATGYAEAGAACLSVLTDSKYFAGSLAFLSAVRNACALPLLCKDFILHPWQIWQARAGGADAVLLIAAALSDKQLAQLAQVAQEAGLTVLAEVHNEREVERVLHQSSLQGAIVGINNRDLTTFDCSLAVTERLAALVPAERLLISESGIRTAADMMRLRAAGAGGFLIGEALMCTANPGERLAQLLGA